jgi:hypothetical protein
MKLLKLHYEGSLVLINGDVFRSAAVSDVKDPKSKTRIRVEGLGETYFQVDETPEQVLKQLERER